MSEVTLSQVLSEREERVLLQKEFLKTCRSALISFTMNIAGPVKDSPLIRRAFLWGLDLLSHRLPSEKILKTRVDFLPTGCRALLAVSFDACTLKSICTEIEEATPLGRLFDLDVIAPNGEKLARNALRGCIVCGAPGRACAAGRLHSVKDLQTVTARILTEHFASADANALASAAVESLCDEVNTTPKPGLVDRRNNGSHIDMTPDTFLNSAEALRSYFCACVTIGRQTAECEPGETFALLRKEGLLAESKMYKATGGVNTHKGAVYSMGILLGSVGRLWKPEAPIAPTADLLSQCSALSKDAAAADFAAATDATSGQRLYLQYGLTGIRGEVASGLPSVGSVSLPIYSALCKRGLSSNDAGAVTLIHLIAQVKDTNLYHRGGEEGAVFAAEYAKTLLAGTPIPSLRDIEAMDDALIKRNLSPGGCADLLALTYLLHKLSSERWRLANIEPFCPPSLFPDLI